MSTLVKEFPKFNISLDLQKAEEQYSIDNAKSFLSGSFLSPKNAREVEIKIEAVTAGAGLIENRWGDDVSYSLPLTLSEKDILAMESLSSRLVNEVFKQTRDGEWELCNPLKKDNIWYVKCKVKRGVFTTRINNGKVSLDNCNNCVDKNTPVVVVGTFSIWMNAARNQYGVCFAAKSIDF